jgi:hypothetical protein
VLDARQRVLEKQVAATRAAIEMDYLAGAESPPRP